MIQFDWKRYILVFFITIGIFLSAFYLSNYFNQKKINELKSIQDQVSTDILSIETQFSLLEELTCKDVDNSFLSQELGSLGEKIAYSEENFGRNSAGILNLKKYYSLLEIKDYLLMKKLKERCGLKSVFVLFFYSNQSDCDKCLEQGYALTALKEKYPGLRVYSFDYHLDLSAIRALTSIYEIGEELPALVINRKVYSGFRSIEDIEKILPELKTLKVEEPKKEKDKDSE
jgi:hypothetical protein